MKVHDPECALCISAEKEGWWGVNELTHCRTCGATWTMDTKIAHCVGCHQTFSSPGVADRHRSDGVCLDPATVVNLTTGENLYGFPPRPNKYDTLIWRGPPAEFAFKRETVDDETSDTSQGGAE